MFQFYAQNELISNLMPATGLKIFGTGACLPWCSISSSFQNSLKTSGHRGYEFLEFWCWNLVPFFFVINIFFTQNITTQYPFKTQQNNKRILSIPKV